MVLCLGLLTLACGTWSSAAASLAPKAFNRLPLGVIQPRGWLLDQLVRQANSLSGYMSKSTFPGADHVNKSLWVGGDGSKQGGTVQWLPYWTNGNVPLISLIQAAGAGDRLDTGLHLADTIDTWMNFVLDNTNKTTGWIGPSMNEPGDRNGHGLWDSLNMVRSLTMWAENKPEQERRVAAAVVAHLTKEAQLLKTDPVIKWASTRWPTFVEICLYVIDTYVSKFGDDKSIMPLGRDGTQNMLMQASALFRKKGMDWDSYYRQTAGKKFPEKDVHGWNTIDHGVNNAEGALNWPATAYRMTRNNSDAHSLNLVFSMLDKYQAQVQSILCADEVFCGREPHRGSETCAIVEAMASLEHSFTVFGNASLMDRIERMAFNALPAALTGDMWTHVYVQQSNSVFAGNTRPTPWQQPGVRGSVKCGRDAVTESEGGSCKLGDTPSGEDEGSNFFGVSHFPCCITNFPQGWPKFAMHALVTDESSNPPSVVVASLVPVEATLPASVGGGAHIVTDTQYPFSDSVTVTVTAKEAMLLKIRIPGWADAATVNGKSAQNGTFAVITCSIGKTVVRVDLNPKIRTEFGWGSLGVAAGSPIKYSAAGAMLPTSDTMKDIDVAGGASLVGSREPNHEDVRSGGPGQNSTASIMHPLAGLGHWISRVTMSYKYIAGYNCIPGSCTNAPRLQLFAKDATSGLEIAVLYTSPPLDKYSYDSYSGYSPLQEIDVQNLRIPNSKLVILGLRMLNGDHNLQVQLDPKDGFGVHVYWSADVGPNPPAPPSPWLTPPEDAMAVTRGALIFALHPNEQKRVKTSFDKSSPFKVAQQFAVDYEISTNDTWNYGLLPGKGFKFMTSPSLGWNASYAFSDEGEYPFSITAMAQQIKSWGYWQGSKITDVLPSSPYTCSSEDCGGETELRLVPFGSTNIRVGVFPWIREDAEFDTVAFV